MADEEAPKDTALEAIPVEDISRRLANAGNERQYLWDQLMAAREALSKTVAFCDMRVNHHNDGICALSEEQKADIRELRDLTERIHEQISDRHLALGKEMDALIMNAVFTVIGVGEHFREREKSIDN